MPDVCWHNTVDVRLLHFTKCERGRRYKSELLFSSVPAKHVRSCGASIVFGALASLAYMVELSRTFLL